MAIRQDEWWDIFEVRMAERLSGGDPAEFVQTLIHIVDSGVVNRVRRELEHRGLTLEDLMEMRAAVANGENADSEFAQAGRYETTDLPEPARAAVKRLFLAQFDEVQIAEMLELEAARVGSFLRRYTFGDDARKIIKLHVAGHTAIDIARQVGTSPQRVKSLIRTFGQEPKLQQERITADQRQKIIRLRREGLGYSAIANEVGVDYYAVRNACRHEARAKQNELTRCDL